MSDTGEEFLLKWNDHHSSFFSIMNDLCSSETLTDVTLSCGGRLFEAHKLMLCVCSSFFRSILSRPARPDRIGQQYPIVFLKGIQPKQMEQLLQYMYHGEINVLQEDLTPLIEAARSLQVKGLSEASTGSAPPQKATPRPPNLKQPPPMMKKGRLNNFPAVSNPLLKRKHIESHAQNMSKPPKSILLSNALTGNNPAAFVLPTEPDPPEMLKEDFGDGNWNNSQSDADLSQQSGGSDYEMNAEMYTDQEDQFYQPGSQTVRGVAGALGGASAGVGTSNNAAGSGKSRLRYKCEECGKGFITPSKLQRHSYSHTGLRPYHCDFCGKSFSQSANLKTHVKNTHPEMYLDGSMSKQPNDSSDNQIASNADSQPSLLTQSHEQISQ